MKTKIYMGINLGVMVGFIIYTIIFPESLKILLTNPKLYLTIRFIHIISVTLFFSNAVIGMLWEARCLVTRDPGIIHHTHETVSFYDARFSTPMIIISLITGVMLGYNKGQGDILTVGWLVVGFALFILSGIVWASSDIPTQYKVKRLMETLEPDAKEMPDEIMKLLWLRMKIGLAGTLPLVAVFIIMVYQPPAMQAVSNWLGYSDGIPEMMPDDDF